MIKGIHHVSMKCASAREAARVRAFYVDLLGMRLAREWPEGMMIDTGCGYIEVFTTGEGIGQKGAIRHLALACSDVDGCVERVRAAGYQVFIEPRELLIPSDPPLRARMAFCKGPLGEEIEFFQKQGTEESACGTAR